jgi:hypothetical protein
MIAGLSGEKKRRRVSKNDEELSRNIQYSTINIQFANCELPLPRLIAH